MAIKSQLDPTPEFNEIVVFSSRFPTRPQSINKTIRSFFFTNQPDSTELLYFDFLLFIYLPIPGGE